jgi:hypothetical protein
LQEPSRSVTFSSVSLAIFHLHYALYAFSSIVDVVSCTTQGSQTQVPDCRFKADPCQVFSERTGRTQGMNSTCPHCTCLLYMQWATKPYFLSGAGEPRRRSTRVQHVVAFAIIILFARCGQELPTSRACDICYRSTEYGSGNPGWQGTRSRSPKCQVSVASGV